MLICNLTQMQKLWSTRGATLASQRVNGYDPEQFLLRVQRAHLVENFNQVSSEPQPNELDSKVSK
jgi:hypothetical protein